MNENPELGSFWKGRVLMQVFAIKTDKPVYKVEPIPEEDCEKARSLYLKQRRFRFMAQVNSAIALPKDDVQYEIQIKVGEHEINCG